MYEFSDLKNTSIGEMTDTWNLAFSDYIVPMDMTPERLEAYFKISGVDYSLSFGAFRDGALVGMLMNSIDMFKGRLVAYDAMTGIVPEHRGRKLFSKLLEYTREILIDKGITRYCLEVIQTNDRAFAIYKSKGGEIERELTFLKGRIDKDVSGVQVLPLSAYPNEEITEYYPSFSNRMSSLRRNIDDYYVAFAGESAAIFNTKGRIPQVVDKSGSLNAVLAYLSRNFKELEISNIPDSEKTLISELKNTGFKVLIKQYEMCIEL